MEDQPEMFIQINGAKRVGKMPRRNKMTDKQLKLDSTIFRVHSEVLAIRSPVLAKMMKSAEYKNRSVLPLEQLKVKQPCLTPTGVDLALDWMYGETTNVEYLQIVDAMAAAHALELKGLFDEIEQRVCEMAEGEAVMIALELAVFNLSTARKQEVLESCSVKWAELMYMPSFPALLFPSFKALFIAARQHLPDQLTVEDLFEGVLIWTRANRGEIMKVERLVSLIPPEHISDEDLAHFARKSAKADLSDLSRHIGKLYKQWSDDNNSLTDSVPDSCSISMEEHDFVREAAGGSAESLLLDDCEPFVRAAAGASADSVAVAGIDFGVMPLPPLNADGSRTYNIEVEFAKSVISHMSPDELKCVLALDIDVDEE